MNEPGLDGIAQTISILIRGRAVASFTCRSRYSIQDPLISGGPGQWGTFTTEGTGSFLQPSTGLTFSGRVTVWGNFNVNERNSNNTFTATFKLTAVDSSGVTHTESGHIVQHIAFNAVDPSTPVVEFIKFNATCS